MSECMCMCLQKYIKFDYALKFILKINLKISSAGLGKILNLSFSGPSVRQQMILQKENGI